MRTKSPFLIVFSLFISFVGNTQNCGEIFYDSGGVSENYNNNETITTTICPDNAGEVVTVIFSSFEIENNFDILSIYDGDTTENLLGYFTGMNSPETITASISYGGCLTFVFTSDSAVTRPGWEASVNCELPPSCLSPTEFLVDGTTETTVTLYWSEINDPQATEWEVEYGITGFTQGTGTLETLNTNIPTITGLLTGTTYDVYLRTNCAVEDSSYWSDALTFITVALPPACGGMFYDSGGVSGNYNSNETITTTICPDNAGEVVSVVFSSFDLESNYDFLSIYDGDSTSNLLGRFTGTNSPETITASASYGGCLTFVFTSDQVITKPGWESSVNCGIPPSCLSPTEFLVDGTTETTVTLYWSEINDPQATEWEVEYGITGFLQGTGTLETLNTNIPTITGLLTGTTYDVYLRANCAVEDSSYWSSVISFTTGGVLDIVEQDINSFKVYPNPTKNSIFITTAYLHTDTSIRLFTIQGQQLFNKENVTNSTQIDISNLENGVYFLTIFSNNQSSTKKIIKK